MKKRNRDPSQVPPDYYERRIYRKVVYSGKRMVTMYENKGK